MTEQAPSQNAAPTPAGDTRVRAQKLLTDILGLMGFPARLEFQDASDGSLAVALHFEAGLPPGVENGKRSQVVDSLQFLLNKMLHRPGVERRWVLLGAGVFPEPRPRKEPQAPAPAGPANGAAAPRPPAQPRAQAPAPAAAPAKPARAQAPAQAAAPAPQPQARRTEADERTVEVAEDAALKEAARKLAEKSASLGRFYALAGMKLEDRARVLKAVEGVAGVAVTGEGEGRCRRVVFTPEKPAPLPKRMLLPDDDEDDFEG
ncbi:MAG TPA: hypothetical protein VF815_13895 [Myxococcaceae bacterium]